MPMLTPWSKTLCPFCFERFHLNDAPWRPLANVNPAPDERVRRFFDIADAPVLPSVVVPQTGFWGRMKGKFVPDNERIRDHDRVCPHCHMPLPQGVATGELDTEVIAVIGERFSGKSVYFGVLIHLLTQGHLARDAGFGVVAQPSWDLNTREKVPSSTLYQERYGRYLFDQKQDLPPGQALATKPELRAPLIYRLMFYKRDRNGQVARPATIEKVTDLVLFDFAGEDLENSNTMTLTLHYLTRAAGVIFLVNPLRLQGVRKQLPVEVSQRLRGDEARLESRSADVLDSFLNLFDRDPRYGAKRTIDVPVSIALTKLDMLNPLIDPGSRVLTSPNHLGGFDREDAMRVSAEVEGYLEEWAGGAVRLNLNRFTNAGYFALTSLGGQPDEDLSIRKFAPHRVGDPLFWILNRLGYMPSLPAPGGAR